MIFGHITKRSLWRNLSKQDSYITRSARRILWQYYRECQNNYLVKSFKLVISTVKIFAKLIGQFSLKGEPMCWLGTILKHFWAYHFTEVLLFAFGLPWVTQFYPQISVVYVPEIIIGWLSSIVVFMTVLIKIKHSALEMVCFCSIGDNASEICKINWISHKFGSPGPFPSYIWFLKRPSVLTSWNGVFIRLSMVKYC